MEEKSITISSDYYIYIMNDILSRMNKMTKELEKDPFNLFSLVTIPVSSISFITEKISLTKSEGKVILSSKEQIEINKWNYTSEVKFDEKEQMEITHWELVFHRVDYSNVKVTLYRNHFNEKEEGIESLKPFIHPSFFDKFIE